ncbi:histone deacetylase family protein [Sneathiella chinensis]|uniref:Acetoin utilization protein n=1 Tax=Sneathiella chinensis TaxID=349750 RepID=A0ABQ5U2I4_9PROT|nr:histone deacetylase family protein [Sneathiella chinensis]GLQ06375.1 acetoin utilization protein [Sneathiella chinensis]
MTTHLFTHKDCLFHDTGPGHPEMADRLRSVLHHLDEDEFAALIRHEASRGTRELLELVHDPDYLDEIERKAPKTGIIQLDPDTFMSPGSIGAALRGVGAVRDAIDLVMSEPGSNAFCAIRPPGHHAEKDRAMGFCLYNNVAIGAVHARQAHGLDRVAVIDFDVHHGNGTQALFEQDAGLFYGSTHQAAPFYPGTGHVSETGVGNVVNAPLPAGAGSAEFRAAMEKVVLPALDAFQPELLIISAGFDAHHRDPRADIDLDVSDFEWITRKLMDSAERHCRGRIVSVLEGGYDLVGLGESAQIHVKTLLGA